MPDTLAVGARLGRYEITPRFQRGGVVRDYPVPCEESRQSLLPAKVPVIQATSWVRLPMPCFW